MATKPKPKDAQDADAATPPAKRGRGRPKFVASKQQRDVTCALVSCGINYATIAVQIGVPLRTLKRHFKEELKSGTEIVKAKICLGVVARALAGDNKAAMFLLTTRFGFSTRHEVSGPGGGPIDLRNLSSDELTAALVALAERGDTEAN